MNNRKILIAVWTAVFLFASAALTLLSWRIYFGLSGAPARQPNQDTFFWFGLSAVVVPLAFGLLGLGLGVCGFLPATQKKT